MIYFDDDSDTADDDPFVDNDGADASDENYIDDLLTAVAILFYKCCCGRKVGKRGNDRSGMKLLTLILTMMMLMISLWGKLSVNFRR